MLKQICLQFCIFTLYDDCCCTEFADGTRVVAAPEDTDEYRERARDLGYGDDTMRMCADHEFLHSLLAEMFWNMPSPALWDVAHGKLNDRGTEENMVLSLQRSLNEIKHHTAA